MRVGVVFLLVLFLHHKSIEQFQLLVLLPLRFIFLLHFLKLSCFGQKLLVEIQKGLLQYSIFLFLGKVEVEMAVTSFLIDDLVAMGALLVEDLNGQFTVIVQLLQKIAHFFLI